jgi:uncharacterized protein
MLWAYAHNYYMPRPRCCRRIGRMPGCRCFGPSNGAADILLTLDEFEAIRLADFGGLYHENAADRMKISRQTFGRIVESARKKVAQALIEGKTLGIDGGSIEMRNFECSDCKHSWEIPFGTGRPQECPQCKSRNLRRADKGRGIGRGRGTGCGQARRRCGCRRAQTAGGVE